MISVKKGLMKFARCFLLLLCGSLGAEEKEFASSAAPDTGYVKSGVEDNRTSITGDRLDLLTTNDGHRFLCVGNVLVTAVNLRMTCDELDVLSRRERTNWEKSTGGGSGRISAILAKGKVRIEQEGRRAMAGKATIDVVAGIITLEESPVVWDERGKVTGEVIVLERGKRRAEVRGGSDIRPKVILPSLPDLGFGRKGQKEEDE